jgi:parvulin-like peptidyl-prolyl isomerase
MAKRGKMAREKRSKVYSKKHLARIERERTQTRYITIGAVATLVIVVGLLAYGVINNYVLKPYRTVAVVNEEKISLAEFQDQARLARYSLINQYEQYLQFAELFGGDEQTSAQLQSMLASISAQLEPATLGQGVLEQMVQDILVQQEAERRGITVTDEEVDLYFEEGFGYYPNGTPTPVPTTYIAPTSTMNPTQLALVPPTATPTITPTPVVTVTVEPSPTATLAPTVTPDLTATAAPTSTPQPTATPLTEEGFNQQLEEYYTNFEENVFVTQDVLREAIRRQLLREKVKKAILDEQNVSRDQEHLWARHILVATVEEAQAVLDRLSAGENFADLAKELSTDTGSGANGGDLGWFGPGTMVTEFEEAAFALEVTEISAPVQTTYGYHIIQLIGRETRTLTDAEYDTYAERVFQDWLTETRTNSEVEIFDNWSEDVPEEPALPSA